MGIVEGQFENIIFRPLRETINVHIALAYVACNDRVKILTGNQKLMGFKELEELISLFTSGGNQ